MKHSNWAHVELAARKIERGAVEILTYSTQHWALPDAAGTSRCISVCARLKSQLAHLEEQLVEIAKQFEDGLNG